MDRLSPPPSIHSQEQQLRGLRPALGARSFRWLLELLCNLYSWISRRAHVLGARGFIITLVVAGITNFFFFSGEVAIRAKPAPTTTVSHNDFFDSNPVTADYGRVTGPIADGRIVVTGGGGNIGKHMIRRLLANSTPVTVFDKIFHQDELDDIYSDLPQARELLRVKLGDIRDTDAMKDVMTDDVVGVIHLAAVSRVLWCLENQNDCWDVNERGTEVVLEALADLNRQDRGKRWFVLASSREVYGDAKEFPVVENSQTKPANVYGESKLRAEKVVKRFLEKVEGDKRAGSLYAISLRLSNVYGGAFDHVERLVPSIVTQALSHQVIQIVGGKQQFDLIHIDDAVDAFLLAVQELSHRRQKWSLKSYRTFFDAFNIASQNAAPVDDLIDKIIRYTRSKSPMQYIRGDDRFPNTYRGSTDKAWETLGFRAAVSIEEGLFRLVKLHLQRTERTLMKKLDGECGAASPSIKENMDLHKLNDCVAHIIMDVRGEMMTLLPAGGDPEHRLHADIEVLPSPIRVSIKHNAEGGDRLVIRDNEHEKFYGIKRMQSPVEGRVKFVVISKEELDEGDHIEWEMDVNPERGAMKLILPGSKLQLKPPPATGGPFYLVPAEREIWPFRITPICCPAPAPWPFFRDDPMTFKTEFQRTSLERPYLASPAKTLCDRLSRARTKVQRDLATLSLNTLNGPRRQESPFAPDWANTNLPACSNSCDLPTVCIDTGDCQCVLLSCPARQRFPFSSSANLPILSYPPHSSDVTSNMDRNTDPLLDIVKRSSWLNVLRPQASRFVGSNTSFPKIHVGELHPEDAEWRNNDDEGKNVHLLRDAFCFSADLSMEQAVAAMGASQEDADYVFVPHWDGIPWSRVRMYRTYDYSRDNNPYFDANRVIIPFAHDWGPCMAFEWNAWDMRRVTGLYFSPYVRSSTSWTVMGDHSSPCYRPHQDIVIPPRTCLSPQLYEAFENMSKVKPARDRSVLATFRGTIWGTGAMDRRKLICNRVANDQLANIPNRIFQTKTPLRTLWNTTGGYSYTELLNETIFCPQPAGTTGWATRLSDSIYAGCIPIFIGGTTDRPFNDMIDYSKISISITAADINRLEEILLTKYTLEDVERMQANIMLVRNAFVYPLDNLSSEEVRRRMINERGPLWFALHSTSMRMATKWPMDDVYDRP